MKIAILRSHGSPRRGRNMPALALLRNLPAPHKRLFDDEPSLRTEPGWAGNGIALANVGMEIGL